MCWEDAPLRIAVDIIIFVVLIVIAPAGACQLSLLLCTRTHLQNSSWDYFLSLLLTLVLQFEKIVCLEVPKLFMSSLSWTLFSDLRRPLWEVLVGMVGCGRMCKRIT